MTNHQTVRLNIPSDIGGFISFNCPFCHERFKLVPDDVEAESSYILYCPICGLRHKKRKFVSIEALDAMQRKVENVLAGTINGFLQELEGSLQSSNLISFKAESSLKPQNDKVILEDSKLEIRKTHCCQKQVKLRLLDILLNAYCPYCGALNSWNIK